MNKLKPILLGFIIGVAAITPGLSGGILAIVLGVYAPALDAVMTIHHFLCECQFQYLVPKHAIDFQKQFNHQLSLHDYNDIIKLLKELSN